MDYKDFLKLLTEQAPEFYDQSVNWGVFDSYIGITFGLLFLIVSLIGGWFLWKKRKGLEDDLQTPIIGLIVFLTTLVAVLMIGISISNFIEAKYFPKAYFLDLVTKRNK